ADIREIVIELAHTNGWHRDTAARLLYERRDSTAARLLTNMLANSRLPVVRLHALHVLDGLGALNQGLILKALRDPDEALREHGILLSEKLATNGVISDALWS